MSVSDASQLDMYGPGRKPARARRTDGGGSHAAADRIERTGKAAAQKAAVLRALAEHPGTTTGELAELAGIERHAVARRMPELVAQGYVERVGKVGEYRHRLTGRGWIVLEKIGGAS